jgi:hypothetical protein
MKPMDEMFYVPTEAEEQEAQKKLEPNYLEDISRGISGLTEKVETLSTDAPAPQAPQYQPQYQPKQQDPAGENAQAPSYRGVAVDVAEDGTPYVNTENLDKIYSNKFEILQKQNEELSLRLQAQELEKEKATFIHTKAQEWMNNGLDSQQAYDQALLMANAIENPVANMDALINTVKKNERILPIKDGMYADGVGYGETSPAKMKIGSNEKIVLKVNLPEGQANLNSKLRSISELNRLQDEVYKRYTDAGKVAPEIFFADDNLANASNPAEVKYILETDPKYGKGVRYIPNNPQQFLQNIVPA